MIQPSNETAGSRATLAGHFKIARVDHWIKNVFVVPGIVVALSLQPDDIALLALGVKEPVGSHSVEWTG